MDKKERILYILIQLFFFTLFFPKLTLLTILAAVCLVGYSLLFSPFGQKWQALKARRHLHLMLLFVAWIVISVLVSQNFKQGLRYLDSRLALFYFPLCLGTLQLRKTFRDRVLLGCAMLTTGITLFCLCYGIQRSRFFKLPQFLYNDSFTEIIGQQSVYIALLVNVSIYIFSYHLLFKKSIYKPWIWGAVVFLFGVNYLLASRIMMGALYTTSVAFLVYYIFKRRQYLRGALLLTGLLLGVFIIVKAFPQTANRFRELTYTHFDYQSTGRESHYNMQVDSTQWNGANFRRAAWACGWQLFQLHPVLGTGIGDKKLELFKVYEQRRFLFALRTNKNVHNNYLDVLYSLGLIGFTLFFAGWVALPAINALRHKDGLALFIFFTFAAAWITEVYFDRNLGGMLTGFFIPFLLSDKSLKEAAV